MTWSYSGNPSLSSKDLCRYLIGDTVEDEPLVSDEELAWQLTQQSDVRLAAAAAAESLSRLFARQASLRTPELSVDFTARAKQYYALATQLRREAVELAAIPYAGGISVTDKTTTAANSDRVPPAFTVDLHRAPASAVVPDAWGAV